MCLIKIHKDLPPGELLQREERLRKTFFVHKNTKNVFLRLSSLCVIYPRGRSVRITTKKGLSSSFFSLWKLSLRQILMNFDLGLFPFFSESFFFLSVEVLLETYPNAFDLGNFPYYS
jgi:hypothetical protein